MMQDVSSEDYAQIAPLDDHRLVTGSVAGPPLQTNARGQYLAAFHEIHQPGVDERADFCFDGVEEGGRPVGLREVPIGPRDLVARIRKSWRARAKGIPSNVVHVQVRVDHDIHILRRYPRAAQPNKEERIRIGGRLFRPAPYTCIDEDDFSVQLQEMPSLGQQDGAFRRHEIWHQPAVVGLELFVRDVRGELGRASDGPLVFNQSMDDQAGFSEERWPLVGQAPRASCLSLVVGACHGSHTERCDERC